jgi:hypothetical protein
VHLARIVFRGLGLRSRHSLAVRQDVGNVRFLKPLPPTDFCRLDSTYGHTQELRYPRPHRIALPLAGPDFSCVGGLCISEEVSIPQRAGETLLKTCALNRQRGWPQEPLEADGVE